MQACLHALLYVRLSAAAAALPLLSSRVGGVVPHALQPVGQHHMHRAVPRSSTGYVAVETVMGPVRQLAGMDN
jgi:hypothetical protein